MKRTPVLGCAVCEFEEWVLNFGVPLILRNTCSTIVLSCKLHNVLYLCHGGHRPEHTALRRVACPGILKPHPVYSIQLGSDHFDIVIAQYSYTIHELLSTSSHRCNIHQLLSFLVVIEIAEYDRLILVFKELERFFWVS
jgi:hypothetical protein